MIESLPPLREVIARHGLAAEKSLGQHFLLDLNITRKIARLAGPLNGGTVVEIGPGPGGLTRALLIEGATSVIAIEKDRRCMEALSELANASEGRLQVVQQDAMEAEIGALGSAPRRIVANLPYNISTALLINWLKEVHARKDAIADMILMFQREVAERILAKPGGKDYGRLSVLCQWLCEGKILFHLPGAAFTPPPKVESSVIKLTPREKPLFEVDIGKMERLTAAAFGQRRKMLRSSLKQIWPNAEEILRQNGIDPAERAENLTVEQFGLLASRIA